MRHQRKRHRLGRSHAHRKATLAALSTALIAHKRITTTVTRAKALRMYVEPLLNRAKEDTTHNRREVFRHLQSKDAVTELFGDVATRLGDRQGGYTRVVKLGQRAGDGAEMAVIELVDYNDVQPGGAAGGGRKRRTRRGTSGGGRRRTSEKSTATGTTAKAATAAAAAEPSRGAADVSDAVEETADSDVQETPDTERGEAKGTAESTADVAAENVDEEAAADVAPAPEEAADEVAAQSDAEPEDAAAENAEATADASTTELESEPEASAEGTDEAPAGEEDASDEDEEKTS